MASSIAAVTTGGGGVITTADASGILNLVSGTTTIATIASTGLSTPATINVPNTFGFKNRIINGAMQFDQRHAGAAQTITAAAALAYTVDRWYAYSTGANVTGQQIAGTYASSQNRYQFTGAASVTAIGFGQRIEAKNCYDLANTTATLSCYISNSLLTTVTWTAYYATTTADTFGSLASPTVTSIATGTFTVTSSRAQYTASISVPSAATTGIQILFTVGAQTSGTWIIDTVQFEGGAVATSYDVRSYGTKLALCQRYYEKTFDITTAPAQNITYNGSVGICPGGAGAASVGLAIVWKFAVTKRTTPTMTSFSVSAANSNWYAPAGPDSSVTAGFTNTATSGSIVYASSASQTDRLYYIQATAESEL